MSFKLCIRGRDDMAIPANSANPLILAKHSANLQTGAVSQSDAAEPISRLAGLAAPAICESVMEAMRERSAILSADGVPLWQSDALAGLVPWDELEIELFIKRQARITWLGYGRMADHLAEKLLHRDRDADDRRLCVECVHAGAGGRCAEREAFMLDQLQRCPSFKEITT